MRIYFVRLANQSDEILLGFIFHIFGVLTVDRHPRHVLMRRLKSIGLRSVEMLQLISIATLSATGNFGHIDFRLVRTLFGHRFDVTVRRLRTIDKWL